MPISLSEIQRLKTIVDRSSYIRMAIQIGKLESESPYQIYPDSLTANLGITREELHTELSALTRNKQIQGMLPTFTATWTDPSILTSYSPEQVLQLRGSGMFRSKGYLFFCLGAENPNKSKSQFVDPTRITGFYGMAVADLFAELGRLVGEKALTTDIDRITIQWLPYSAQDLQAAPAETIAAALEDMRQRITEINRAIAPYALQATLDELTLRVAQLERLFSGNPSPQPAAATSIIRINCAGTDYTDSSGKIWQAENYSIGGGGEARPIAVKDTPDQDLFATIRWGLEGYDIPVSAGSYTVRLYFVEPESQFRKFDISLQGKVQQADFSIYSEAGEFGKVLVKTFTNITASDILAIRFRPTVQDAIISAIEVLQ